MKYYSKIGTRRRASERAFLRGALERGQNVIAGGGQNEIYGTFSAILGGYDNTVSANFSQAFGRSVSVNDDYITAFYDDSYPGKVGINEPDPDEALHVVGTVKIEDILKLETRGTAPAGLGTGDRGTIYYHYDVGPPLVNMLYVWDGSDWQPLW
jgi:hypothetical protein